jgi:hypothetical protein
MQLQWRNEKKNFVYSRRESFAVYNAEHAHYILYINKITKYRSFTTSWCVVFLQRIESLFIYARFVYSVDIRDFLPTMPSEFHFM